MSNTQKQPESDQNDVLAQLQQVVSGPTTPLVHTLLQLHTPNQEERPLVQEALEDLTQHPVTLVRLTAQGVRKSINHFKKPDIRTIAPKESFTSNQEDIVSADNLNLVQRALQQTTTLFQRQRSPVLWCARDGVALYDDSHSFPAHLIHTDIEEIGRYTSQRANQLYQIRAAAFDAGPTPNILKALTDFEGKPFTQTHWYKRLSEVFGEELTEEDWVNHLANARFSLDEIPTSDSQNDLLYDFWKKIQNAFEGITSDDIKDDPDLLECFANINLSIAERTHPEILAATLRITDIAQNARNKLESINPSNNKADSKPAQMLRQRLQQITGEYERERSQVQSGQQHIALGLRDDFSIRSGRHFKIAFMGKLLIAQLALQQSIDDLEEETEQGIMKQENTKVSSPDKLYEMEQYFMCREQDALYPSLHHPIVRQEIESTYSIQLSQLSIQEQGSLMELLLDPQRTPVLEKLQQSLRHLSPVDGTAVMRLWLFAVSDSDINEEDILQLSTHEHILPIVRTCTELLTEVENDAEAIQSMLTQSLQTNDDIYESDIHRALLKNTYSILHQMNVLLQKESIDPQDTHRLLLKIAQDMERESLRIRRLRSIIAVLPRKDRASLDLTNLPLIEWHTKTGEEILASADLSGTMETAVVQAFGEKARRLYVKDINDPTSCVHYTMVEGKLLSLFVSVTKEDGTSYLDWYTGNPQAEVQKFAEPTLVTGVQNMDHSEGYYAIANPKQSSLQAAIEYLGMVASGNIDTFGDTYFILRKKPKDAINGVYVTKSLDEEQVSSLRAYTQNKEKELQEQSVQDKDILCTQITIPRDASSSIATESRVWLHRTVEEQSKEGYVLTRMIPDPNDPTVFLCVFEKSALTPEEDRAFLTKAHEWDDPTF